jgi:parvulin-like peptidyl-prolyl isomerase
MRQLGHWLGGFLLGAVLVGAMAGQDGTVWRFDEPAAIVNGEPISKGDLLKRLLADFGEETIKQLITLKLLEQEGAKEGIKVTEEEVAKRFEELQGQRADLEKRLGRGRLSDLTLRDEAKRLLLLERLVAKQTVVSDEELRRFYARHYIRYNRPEEVTIREIVVFSFPEAQEIYQRLRQTPAAKLAETFDRLGKERSVIPGFMGAFIYDELPEEMREPLKKAKPNEILPPLLVKSAGQPTYRIVWVQKKTPAQLNPFEKVRDIVRQDYLVERMVVLAPELVKRLWAKANIQYTVPSLGGTGK